MKENIDSKKEENNLRNQEKNSEFLFKANLDFIGRSYSAYLYLLLIIAITTTTYLLTGSENSINSGVQVSTSFFTDHIYNIDTIYYLMFTWLVYFLGLVFIEKQHLEDYNKILTDYYNNKFGKIERKSRALYIFSSLLKYPINFIILLGRLIVRLLIPLFELILKILKWLRELN
ncbi:MAG: hypothetical protein KAT05_08135 [Spirochaetes bacterium]|nr:hypothetical protein [Spirochaetota bacterium]